MSRSSIAILLVLLAPAMLRAQEPQDSAAPPDSQVSQKPKTIARYGFSDGALAIDVRPGSIIAVAAAQGDSAMTITLRASDARAWTDSTRRYVTRPAPRKSTQVVLQRSMIEEAADSGGAISFLRRAARDTTTFELLFSTRSFGKFPLALERREAALFFAAMRRAVDAARPAAPAKAALKAKAKPKAKADSTMPNATTPKTSPDLTAADVVRPDSARPDSIKPDSVISDSAKRAPKKRRPKPELVKPDSTKRDSTTP
jgi:hypothetical protein